MAGKDERRKSPGAGEDPRRGDVPAKDKSAKRDVAPEKGSFADEAGSGAARAVPTHAAGAEGPVAEAAMDRRVIEDGELTERLMSADRDDRPVEGRTVTHEARQAQGAQEGPRAAAEAASYTPSRQLRRLGA